MDSTMWFFSRAAKPTPLLRYPSYYKGAGCIFISERLILAGYQPNKPHPFISGLGGRRKTIETAPDTAFRETIEELFHIEKVPYKLLCRLQRSMIPQAILEKENYVALVFTIEQLYTLLTMCKRYGLESPLYRKMPKTLEELLFLRLPDPAAEVSHLCFLPLVDFQEPTSLVDSSFLSDIRGILHHSDLRVTS